jgi:hypothetical protein
VKAADHSIMFTPKRLEGRVMDASKINIADVLHYE